MFNSIAHRYDAANAVLSLGLHLLWRRKLIRRATQSDCSSALDLCTGTGGLLVSLKRHFSTVVGLDLSREMLRGALPLGVPLLEGDAEHLPLRDQSFSVVTVAWGIRNIQNLESALLEMRRVLRPAGKLLVLEFGGVPGGMWGRLFGLYARTFLPIVGGIVTGKPEAYRYLNTSSERFPGGDALVRILIDAGFSKARWVKLAGGVAYLYEAVKDG